MCLSQAMRKEDLEVNFLLASMASCFLLESQFSYYNPSNYFWLSGVHTVFYSKQKNSFVFWLVGSFSSIDIFYLAQLARGNGLGAAVDACCDSLFNTPCRVSMGSVC